jgi:hypothetical protein
MIHFYGGWLPGIRILSTGIAVAIGGLITYYISFQVLFIIMGTIQGLATIIQARLLFVRKL